MKHVTLAEAKRDFEIGSLIGYSFDRLPLDGEWTVTLRLQGFLVTLVDARDKKVRYFKSLDSAVSTVESIGFKINSLT